MLTGPIRPAAPRTPATLPGPMGLMVAAPVAASTCERWCETKRVEAHIACTAKLGTVVLAEEHVEVTLVQNRDTNPVIQLTVFDKGPARTITLPMARAQELTALLAAGIAVQRGPMEWGPLRSAAPADEGPVLGDGVDQAAPAQFGDGPPHGIA